MTWFSNLPITLVSTKTPFLFYTWMVNQNGILGSHSWPGPFGSSACFELNPWARNCEQKAMFCWKGRFTEYVDLNFWVDHVGGWTKKISTKKTSTNLIIYPNLFPFFFGKISIQNIFDPILWWIPRSSLHGSSTAFISPFISPTEASIYHQPDSCLQICEVNFSERGLSLSAWRRTRARGFSTLKIFPCQKSMGFWKNVWRRLQIWHHFRYLC